MSSTGTTIQQPDQRIEPATGHGESAHSLGDALAAKPRVRLPECRLRLGGPVLVVTTGILLLTHALVTPAGQAACEHLLFITAVIGCATAGTEISHRLRKRRIRRQQPEPYLVKKRLGSGGMGDVYLAEHRLLRRLCALKLIHPDKASDACMKNHFEREVRATAALTHLNTVEIYDYGTMRSGQFFYAMEYLQGLNLHQIVRRYGPMPPERVVFILKQICGALHEAASEGLVHRDIKPGNIFLAERGGTWDVAKLLDFGLVQPALQQRVGLRRKTTRIHGSPAWMCPEQASGLEPDCRGDLYSLGAVACFLLTGHPPFRGANPVMLIVAHATAPVPNFSEWGINIPEDLAMVVMKCLAKDPAARYTTPRDLLTALESCRSNSGWDWKEAEHWWQQHCPLRRRDVAFYDDAAFEIDKESSDFESGPIDSDDMTLIIDHGIEATVSHREGREIKSPSNGTPS